MKLSLLALATFMISTVASASHYEEWISSTADINCKSVFNHQERQIVTTKKVNSSGTGEYEQITSVEVSSKVQLGKSDVTRKYVVKSVQVNVIDDETEATQPIVITGKHPITGENIVINVLSNEDEDGYSDSLLFIGGQEQDYLKLVCKVTFAG